MDIKTTPTEPMRVFADLSFNWVTTPDGWADVDFYMRPMKNTERALYKDSLKRVTKARKTSETMDSLGYGRDDIDPTIPGLTEEQKLEAHIKWAQVRELRTIDPEEEKKHNLVVKSVLLDCTSTVRIGSDEMPFGDDMFEAIGDEDVINWLIGVSLAHSTLTGEETASL